MTDGLSRSELLPMFGLRSFATRLALTYALLTTATVAIVLVAGRLIVGHQVVHGLDLLNNAEFMELADRLPAPASAALDDRALKTLHEHTAIDSSMYFFQVGAPDGTILFRSANLGAHRLPTSSPATDPATADLPEIGPVRIGNYPYGAVHIQVASPLTQTHELLAQQTATLFALGVGVALLSVGLGYAFSRLVLRPVRAIEQTALRIGAENLSERIPVPAGRDYFTKSKGAQGGGQQPERDQPEQTAQHERERQAQKPDHGRGR